ncbi:PDZ domain-containing protein [Akkermansiaceae bacterium]|nr:PDZ domain-containing protein [Akkermansiaceae bacterium]
MTLFKTQHRYATAAALISLSISWSAEAQSFYKEPQLFSTAPNPTKSVSVIERFGPVGIAIELHQPAFTMKVKDIEPGSPAEATGRLKKGQVIESINGEKLKDIDPRIQLGGMIAAAEASDGIIRLAIEGETVPVVVKIPVLGAYSKTWPLNCPKSDRIVRDFADHLAKPDSNKGFADIGMLFLLSTGEDKDIPPVRDWVHGMIGKKPSQYAWHIGYGGIGLCEYYLRTGDKEALPVIQSWVEAAAKGEYLDGWAGRGGVTAVTYGNGHLNAAGTGVVTFLLLAKECGAEVNDSLLHRTLTHYFRFAGRGLNPYGDDRPENSFVDNGKNGILAFTMAAAASLTPDGENSIYARARDTAAMTSFYTTSFMLHGHTGGGIGEIWRSSAMGLIHDKRPNQYRDFMDKRQWHYDLSRRFDGSFGILGGAGYDKPEWGAGYALTYTIPRKTLRITGAASEFSKPYKLPERPWGTAADDEFQSLEAVADKDGKRQDLTGETLAADSSMPLIRRIKAMGDDVSDDVLRQYVRHQEYLVRRMAANHAMGLNFSYMFKEPGLRVRPALVEEFARSEDPRIRNAGLRSIAEQFDPAAEWAPGFYQIAAERLADPEESWFVKDAALSVIGQGTPDMIVAHVDLLLPYLNHPEQWLQNGALKALAAVIVDERCYARVIPAVGAFLRTCNRYSTTGGPVFAIRQNLPSAGPEAGKLAIETFGESFGNYDTVKVWEGGQDISNVHDSHLGFIAASLGDVPGGLDVLYELARQRFPDQALPYPDVFLNADPQHFTLSSRRRFRPSSSTSWFPRSSAGTA